MVSGAEHSRRGGASNGRPVDSASCICAATSPGGLPGADQNLPGDRAGASGEEENAASRGRAGGQDLQRTQLSRRSVRSFRRNDSAGNLAPCPDGLNTETLALHCRHGADALWFADGSGWALGLEIPLRLSGVPVVVTVSCYASDPESSG